MSTGILNSVKSSPVRDTYRFGDGPEPVLQPGTMGWTASEMKDPVFRCLWDAGRYEILNGGLLLKEGKYVDDGNGKVADLVIPACLPGLRISLAEVSGEIEFAYLARL